MQPRTAVLLILDGFGVNPKVEHNAVAQAKAPVFRRLLEKYPHTTLQASESFVGLPNGFMGNSEVGHLNIGAGRVVYQDFSLISHAIEEGSFFKNPAFTELFEKMRTRPDAALHLMGLLSDGGVHSHLSHLFSLLQLAKREKVKYVWIHAMTDGRDTAPTSGRDFVAKTQRFCADLGIGKFGLVSGRFFAMDRDSRWDRTEKAYSAIVKAEAEEKFDAPDAYLLQCYSKGETDEFIPPAVQKKYPGVKDGDGVVFYNFRADRARQLTRAFVQADFSQFKRKTVPSLSGFVCMGSYDDSLPLTVAYQKTKVPSTVGELVSGRGWQQLRIAETEKYAHVTYFFNGGEEKVFPGEKRILVPSPRDVRTYDLKPEMSVFQVTAELLKELKSGEYKFVVCNFANPDMVGHTGNLNAAIKAVEAVDQCLGKILDWVESHDAFLVLTADHGNCEMMQDGNGIPLTSHTLLPVPFVVADAKRPKIMLRPNGSLCDIAPTLLSLWGIPQPKEMNGKSLVAAL